jgi:hypothetical protein
LAGLTGDAAVGFGLLTRHRLDVTLAEETDQDAATPVVAGHSGHDEHVA